MNRQENIYLCIFCIKQSSINQDVDLIVMIQHAYIQPIWIIINFLVCKTVCTTQIKEQKNVNVNINDLQTENQK